MPLRDDHEAARHRIDALERELEETRARAERAEREARAAREVTTGEVAARPARDEPRTGERGAPRTRPDEGNAPRDDASWPAADQRRFERAAALAVCVLDAPVLVLLAGWRLDLDDLDASVFGWTLAPILVLVPILYALARAHRAPFPSSAAIVSLLGNGIGWFAMYVAASDMLWGDLLAEPPLRWLARGLPGLLAVGLHALVIAKWCSEAALSDAGSGD